jgi:hypothetical protein
MLYLPQRKGKQFNRESNRSKRNVDMKAPLNSQKKGRNLLVSLPSSSLNKRRMNHLPDLSLTITQSVFSTS